MMKLLIVALVVVVVSASPRPSRPRPQAQAQASGVKVVNMEWLEEQTHKDIDKRAQSCPADYCRNGGQCIQIEESTMNGHDYLCVCNGDFGGYRCGVARPCDSCPVNLGAVYCVRSAIESTGRYCYDKDYNMIDEASNAPDKRIFWWLWGRK